jgi:AcrR family transcriptional regulator
MLNVRSANSLSASDMTAEARIRQAAVERFPVDGIEGTTVRAIAADAGVSPALVLHHFGSKQGLLDACDHYVVELVRTTKTRAIADGTATDAGFIASMYRMAPPIVRYLGWSLSRGAPATSRLFDELVQESERLLAVAEEQGMVRSSPDPHGRAVVLLTMQLGFVVLHEHVSRALGMDPFGLDGLMRITEREMEVFTGGLFTPEAARVASQGVEAASQLMRKETADGG